MSNIPFDYQHILENAFNEIFNNNSQNFALQYQDFTYDLCNNTINSPPDDIPDLIPVIEEPVVPVQQEPPVSSNQMQLWANLVEDYNAQIQLYQQNIRSIIHITENVFRPSSTNTNTNTNANHNANANANHNTSTRRSLISQLRNLFQNSQYNPEQYVLEFENITPLIFSRPSTSTNVPTTQEIQNATELFVYDSRNPIEYTTCPISLEEFREGEPLMRIRNCGHIFKAFELQRWFLRNTRCPSCRFDICVHNR